MAAIRHFLFAPFRLDPVNRQLWRGDTLVAVRPKPFAVLQYLVAQAGRVVSQEELRKAVWATTYVSEGVLRDYIRELRAVLGDEADASRFIETIPRRGYRFIAPLTTAPPVQSPRPVLSVVEGSTVQSHSLSPPHPVIPSGGA
ncbi:MAG: winged helix-turn-helix domain-containing protein [Candidatus Binatia bacterium]